MQNSARPFLLQPFGSCHVRHLVRSQKSPDRPRSDRQWQVEEHVQGSSCQSDSSMAAPLRRTLGSRVSRVHFLMERVGIEFYPQFLTPVKRNMQYIGKEGIAPAHRVLSTPLTQQPIMRCHRDRHYCRRLTTEERGCSCRGEDYGNIADIMN